ncbi:DNA ligase [Alteromonas hispanica]|uniref:DNA ligase n=1 Tax=Alteromonas hispanica TaxID=315421 RepID=A0A6L9MVG5_9ALTE|nr:DNA ligase [Alteromonas hispanica]
MKTNKMVLIWIAVLSLLLCDVSSAGMLNNAQQLASRYTVSHQSVKISDYLVSEKLDGIRARWTGEELLTRTGHPISAPEWFTQSWPRKMLDGELWLGRGKFEETASIVLSDTPDERWRTITFMVFDMPHSKQTFEKRVDEIKRIIAKTKSSALMAIPQYGLDTHEALQAALNKITDAGGEGLMLHYRHARYTHGRSSHLLKLKKHEDSEAKVIAHIKGKGKFKSMLGSLLVQTAEGVQFKLGTGFSNEERLHPPHIGQWVTYKYYGYTGTGKPRFASFMHVRPQKDLQHNIRAFNEQVPNEHRTRQRKKHSNKKHRDE